VAIKFGIKAGSILASAVFSLALVAGCNTEEAAPESGPKAAPGTAAPGKAPEAKPAPTPTPAPTPPKEDAKPK
jgi:hypothetical protein